VKIHSTVLATILAAPLLALSVQPAAAFGNAAGTGGFVHVTSSNGNGGGHMGGGHGGGRTGGQTSHGGGWSGHPGWGGGHGWHHHDHDGGGWGGGWGFGYWGPYSDPWLWGWGYPYYGYPYYAPSYPAYVVPDTGAVPSAPPPPAYWYYCPSAKAYYPYVSQCPEPWVPVSPTPPG
jgi:hypothetical protein